MTLRPLHLLLWLALFAWQVLAGPTIDLGNGQKYELQDRLGSGGFGVVYRAKRVSDGKIVAVKLFKYDEDYERESKSPLAQIPRDRGGQRIVPMLDQGFLKKFVSLPVDPSNPDPLAPHFAPMAGQVMEEIDTTLDKQRNLFVIGAFEEAPTWLNYTRLRMASRKIGPLANQMLATWAMLSENGVIHGDLKPSNIGLHGPDRDVVLLDIGAAVKGPLKPNEANKVVVSTPGFEGPEIPRFREWKLRDNESVSAYADLYSMAQTMLDVMCHDCTVMQLRSILASAYQDAKDRPDRDETFAPLFFALDVIEAGVRISAADRYTALRDGPLNRYVHFRAPRDWKEPGYTTLIPELTKPLPEILAEYKANAPKRAKEITASLGKPLSVYEFNYNPNHQGVFLEFSESDFASMPRPLPDRFLKRFCKLLLRKVRLAK